MEFLKSLNGLEFLKSEKGIEFLKSSNWLEFLKSESGLEFLKSSNGLEFLKSKNGVEFLKSENGNKYKRESLTWRKFWKMANGKEYKKWLYSNDYSCNRQTAGEPQRGTWLLSSIVTVVSEPVKFIITKKIASSRAKAALVAFNHNRGDPAATRAAWSNSERAKDVLNNVLSLRVLTISAVVTWLAAAEAGERAKKVGAGWWATNVAAFGGGIAGGAGVLAVAVGLTTPLGIGLAVVGGAGLVVFAITIIRGVVVIDLRFKQ